MSALQPRNLARELEETNFQLNHRLVQMEALYQAGLVLSSSLDSAELRGEFLRLAVGTIDARCGFLFLREDGGLFELAEEANFAPQDLTLLSTPVLHALMDDVVSKQQPALLAGEQLSSDFPGECLLLIPVGEHGCIGVIDRETRDGITPFGEMDGHLLEMMGQQAGMALANAQLFRQVAEERNINVNIFNSVGHGVISTDLHGTIMRTNPAAQRILGSSAEDLVGKSLVKRLEEGGCPALAQAIRQTLADGSPRQVPEERMARGEVLLHARVTPLLTPDSRVEGTVVALEDVTEQARLESMFKQYASDQVVDMLLAGDSVPSLGGEVREATMLFLDTVGSTELLGKIGGEEMVSLMNDAYTGLVELVFRYNGTLDKYTGDGFMAVFGAPLSQPDDNHRAVLCALEIVDEMKRFNETHAHNLEIKIGLSRGYVVAGNIGSPRRMEYSVIGPDVNLAARLCDQASAGEILVSSRVQSELEDDFGCEYIGRQIFKGIRESLDVYRLRTVGEASTRQTEWVVDEAGGEARVALDIPMLQNMEVIVSQMAEAFGRYIGMNTDSLDEIRAALVEACINAFEHSQSKTSRLRLEFVSAPEALTVTISDQGHGFDVDTALAKVRARREAGDMCRGWGLELIGEFMDDVRIDSGPGGTTLTLVKRRPDA